MEHVIDDSLKIHRGGSAPVSLLKVSNPPTEKELESYEDVSINELPRVYKRKQLDRIFVNRDLRLDRIKWVGFDMDYTLADYNSPNYEELAYDLMVKRLIVMGYPEDIKKLKYDPSFALRGTFLDTVLGNQLKIDTFGNIVVAVHGRSKLTKQRISELYPSMYVQSEEFGKRYYPYSTLFNLPEACLFADLVEFFESNLSVDSNTYNHIFQDIRVAMDYVHLQGELKTCTLENMEKFIKKTPNIALMLSRLRNAGMKLFLLTNSEFYYTDKVMSYLLHGQLKEYETWRDYFDINIVGARKPIFFSSSGTTLREVDITTGNLKIGTSATAINSTTPLSSLKGKVYQGGSIKILEQLGVKGNQVLYIGDHIYADIIKSKKAHAWRTILVIPELQHELKVAQQSKKTYEHLLNLEYMKAEAFRGLDSESVVAPEVTALRKHIKQTTENLNNAYNPWFGSLFTTGSKLTHFSMQVQRYADLYTYDWTNLLHYPMFYQFSAPHANLPHSNETSY